jgi:hypothetical protein
MAKIITIYCEGKKGSHDFDILEKIIGDVATIKPIGGKRGANAIIEFVEKGTTQSDFYLFFRDRDFDCEVPKNEKLTFDGKKTYFSYRTTIENYLFDTKLFFKFIEENQLTAKYKIDNENEVKNIFIETARDIQYYQAVRCTLGELRFPNSFDTTWISDGSGHLPLKLDLETCKTNGWNLISDVVSKNNMEWTKDKFLSKLDKFINLFDDRFFNELKFLVYFQGKDFAKTLTNKLPNFSLKNYYKFSKEYFDYKNFGDLVELRNIITTKIR